MTLRYEDFTWVPSLDLEQRADRDEPWCFYLNTEVYLESAIRSGIIRPAASRGSDKPPFGPLHVLSATQPDEEPDSRRSKQRLTILDQELKAADLTWIRALGSSMHGMHSEESRAIFGLDDYRARALGRRFGQIAVFAWRGPRWSLLACAADRREHRSWTWTEHSPKDSPRSQP